MRLPNHPWKPTRARRERQAEVQISTLAAQIDDINALGAILLTYPPETRRAVLDRIAPHLRPEVQVQVAAMKEVDAEPAGASDWDPPGYRNGHPDYETETACG